MTDREYVLSVHPGAAIRIAGFGLNRGKFRVHDGNGTDLSRWGATEAEAWRAARREAEPRSKDKTRSSEAPSSSDDFMLNPANPLSPISPFNPTHTHHDVSPPPPPPSCDPPSSDSGGYSGSGDSSSGSYSGGDF